MENEVDGINETTPRAMATPDAADGSKRQDSVIAASAAMLSLSTLTVVLRFHTRHVLLGILGADDWMILAALVRGAPEMTVYLCSYRNIRFSRSELPWDRSDVGAASPLPHGSCP
jgi:hypothetical protein